MSFIAALNNPEMKALIEQIEELCDTECPVLLDIKADLVAQLAQLGYDY